MKKKNLLISLGAVLTVAVALFIWSVLAKNNFEEMSGQFEQEYKPLADQMNNLTTSDGKPQEMIQYKALIDLIHSFQSRKEILSGLQAKIANGEGMGFWYPSARKGKADTCKANYDGMSHLIETANPAVDLLHPINQEVQAVLSASNNSRQLAVRVLARDNDISDFQERSADLKAKMPLLYKKVKELEISLGKSLLTSSSDDFRKSMLRSMLVSLKDEAGQLQGRIVATSEARKSLEGYKAKVNNLFANNSNLLGSIQYVSGNLRPAIVFAYEKTQPMRNFFQQADEPIFGGDLGGAIASLFSRGGSGEKLSALSLAKGMDPSISLTVDVLQGTCEEIESVYRVSNDLNEITQPMMIALSEYRGLPSRANLLRLVETVKPAAAFYDSKKDLFDPALNKIEEGRQSIQRLYSVADRIRIQAAGNLMRQGAAIGENLISAAESPFLQGRRALTNLAESLSQVQNFEENYINNINTLTKERIITQSFSFQKEPQVEDESPKDKVDRKKETPIANPRMMKTKSKNVEAIQPPRSLKEVPVPTADDANKIVAVQVEPPKSLKASEIQGTWITTWDHNREIVIEATGEHSFTGKFNSKKIDSIISGKIEGELISVKQENRIITMAQMYGREKRYSINYSLVLDSPNILRGTCYDEKSGTTYNNVVWTRE